jgi:hypothetical protein
MPDAKRQINPAKFDFGNLNPLPGFCLESGIWRLAFFRIEALSA